MTPEEIAQYFREMEEYLFKSMSRNLSRHEAWEAEEGFEWVQWQAEQINGLRAFREEVMDIVNATYDKASPDMERLLKDAYHEAEERAQIDLSKSSKHTYRQQFFGTPPKMRSLVETLLNDVSETRYAVINRMNNGMLGIIQRADLFAQSGTMTLQQAVDMAAKDFVSAGLNCVEYSNGARVGIDSYLEMALRTSARDAAMIAEGTKRQEWGEFLVVSNVINTTCPACMKWQGKVLIDDINSNGKPDGKHIRLSVAKANGFLHPNCRHKPYTYIEGVTPIPSKPDKAKTKEQYEAEQKQRYYERNIRKYKRLRDCAVDPANKEKYEAKVKEWSKALDEHLDANPQLRKNSWRTSGRGTATRTDAPKVTAIEPPKPTVKPVEPPKVEPVTVEPPRAVTPIYFDANSIEEAQEFASKFVEPKFMDRTFKGEVDFKGLSVENANSINHALQNVYENFPELEKLSGIKVVDPKSKIGKKAFKDGADAVFAYDPIQNGIYINKDILKNQATFDAYMKKSDEAWDVVMSNIDNLSGEQKEIALRYQKAGRSLVGQNVQDLFTHELGHHAQWTLYDTPTVNKLTSAKNVYGAKISGYASTSGSEYLAESFTAYMKGERNILDPEFVSLLDGKLKPIANSGGGTIELVRRDTSVLPTVELSNFERWHITSELNTNLTAEERQMPLVTKPIGDYVYTVENHGFGDYRCISKKPITRTIHE